MVAVQTSPAETPQTVYRFHAPACPCLACADWRAERRGHGLRGRWPRLAKDWRGVEFVP